MVDAWRVMRELWRHRDAMRAGVKQALEDGRKLERQQRAYLRLVKAEQKKRTVH